MLTAVPPPPCPTSIGNSWRCPALAMTWAPWSREGARGTLTESVQVEEGRMPQYLSPGVYVEEVEAGSRPIEGVGTAVAAFVGLAATGPFNEPTLVTNWSQFTQTFGDF